MPYYSLLNGKHVDRNCIPCELNKLNKMNFCEDRYEDENYRQENNLFNTYDQDMIDDHPVEKYNLPFFN